MIPDFAENGFLPPGVHGASISEFRDRFGQFDRSDRRCRLFESFAEVLEDCRSSGLVERIIVGGSYVSAESEPNDFDCVLMLHATARRDDLLPSEYNLVSPKRARVRYAGDVFSAITGTPAAEKWVAFFQASRANDRVGVIEIRL